MLLVCWKFEKYLYNVQKLDILKYFLELHTDKHFLVHIHNYIL